MRHDQAKFYLTPELKIDGTVLMEIKNAIASDALVRVDVNDLVHFQGNLKDLSEENYNRLKAQILELGFSFVIHAWANVEGKRFILDGHQRVRTLLKMRQEGFTVPPIPVVMVQANDFQQAKKKVLAGTSQFGEMTGQGLYEFIAESGLDWRDVVRDNRFPEIDPVDFVVEFFDQEAEPKQKVPGVPKEKECPECGHTWT